MAQVTMEVIALHTLKTITRPIKAYTVGVCKSIIEGNTKTSSFHLVELVLVMANTHNSSNSSSYLNITRLITINKLTDGAVNQTNSKLRNLKVKTSLQYLTTRDQ